VDESRRFGGIHPVHAPQHDWISATSKQGTAFGPIADASMVSAGGGVSRKLIKKVPVDLRRK